MPEEHPQGATTGRYELLANVGKPKQERKWKRWSDVPMWYRALDRFGLPTIVVLLLLWGGYRIANVALTILDKQATAFSSALSAQVEATNKLSKRIEDSLSRDKNGDRR